MDEYLKCYLQAWGKIFDFNGRASRKEFWLFVLINFVLCFILSFVLTFLLAVISLGHMHYGVIPNIIKLLFFVISLAVSIRRLHDIGKSGWWWLLGLVPIIGGLILLYFYVCPGEQMFNEYGKNPRE